MRALIQKISAICLLLVFSGWVNAVDSGIDKKLNKFIFKTFKDKTIVKKKVDVPDSLAVFSENKFYCLKKKDSLVGYLAYNRANSCRVGGCVAFDSNNRQGNYDPFYFATIYTPELVIKEVKIIQYYSEYGYEISSKGWLKQFIGISGCDNKLEEKIEGISGATISVKSMLQEIESNCELFPHCGMLKGDTLEVQDTEGAMDVKTYLPGVIEIRD